MPRGGGRQQRVTQLVRWGVGVVVDARGAGAEVNHARERRPGAGALRGARPGHRANQVVQPGVPVDDVEEHGVGAEGVDDADGGADRAVAFALLGDDGAPLAPAAAGSGLVPRRHSWRRSRRFVLVRDPEPVNLASLRAFLLLLNLLPHLAILLLIDLLLLLAVVLILLASLSGLPEHLDDHRELHHEIPELIRAQLPPQSLGLRRTPRSARPAVLPPAVLPLRLQHAQVLEQRAQHVHRLGARQGAAAGAQPRTRDTSRRR